MNNCTVVGNSAALEGGGAWVVSPCDDPQKCGLPGCQETGCSATPGVLNNCIIYYNYAPIGANYQSNSILNYCSTIPLPAHGLGNITNAPLLVNREAGNLRLESNSPCINAGLNSATSAGSDLDGNPRIRGGTVDIGAYEFQSPQSAISYAWLQEFGLPIGSADLADPDGDGHNNWQEWRAGTNPTNSLSVLRLLTPIGRTPRMVVRWQSVSDRTYFLERSTNTGGQSAFTSLVSDLVGHAGTTVFADTNAVGTGPFFYRVGVKE